MTNKLVFMDIETSGLNRDKHAIIQIAACAVTLPEMAIVDTFEVKIRFNKDNASPFALANNVYATQVQGVDQGLVKLMEQRMLSLPYDERAEAELLTPEEREVFFADFDLWEVSAVHPAAACKRFFAFLNRHATLMKISKAGKPYNVAVLAGHNIISFDIPFLQSWQKRLAQKDASLSFPPFDFFALDTLQMALQAKLLMGIPYPDLKLKTLCQYHGLAGEQTHDALDDIYLTVALARALHHKIFVENAISQSVTESTLTQGLPEPMKQQILL